MPKENLIRLGGLAAILAGILRGVGSVVPDTSPDVALQILYFFTDLFIILGIITLYGIFLFSSSIHKLKNKDRCELY